MLLLENGATVDPIDCWGRTPLHKVTWHWRDCGNDIVKFNQYNLCAEYLIKSGANLHIIDIQKPIAEPNLRRNQHKLPGTPEDSMKVSTPLDDAMESANYANTKQKQELHNQLIQLLLQHQNQNQNNNSSTPRFNM